MSQSRVFVGTLSHVSQAATWRLQAQLQAQQLIHGAEKAAAVAATPAKRVTASEEPMRVSRSDLDSFARNVGINSELEIDGTRSPPARRTPVWTSPTRAARLRY